MAGRTVTEADLNRLKADQEAAGRAYNDALTLVDQAMQSAPDRPAPSEPYDEHQINALNERWRILPPEEPPLESGWRGKLAAFIWHLVSPYLSKQQAFNSAMVDHLNRNIEGHRQVRRAAATMLTLVHDHISGLVHFQSMLVQYLQSVTPFVDTKDYEFVGILRRLTEDTNQRADGVDDRLDGFTAGLGGVSDELQRRLESMLAREGRSDARATSLAAAHAELQTSTGVMQQAVHTLKRELERLHGPHSTDHSTAASESGPAPGPRSAFTSSIDSYKYVGFEDQFRGSQKDIRARIAEYLPNFEGASDVLDIGCGRGEFLDVLGEHGITARGLDINHEMVEVCRDRGLRADEGDAVSYLSGLPDGSLGGLFAAQVVEHLQPDYLIRLIDVAYDKLRPGSTIVLETINPACWFAFFESYIRDISHVRPIHPDTLKYLLLASGFQRVDVRYRAPYPEHEKLRPLPGESELTETFNANVEKLNGLLFTHMDYAAIGQRS